jgi:hypothetical protein
MMHSFCAAANLRGLLQSFTCPDVILQCLPIVEKAYGSAKGRGTLLSDIQALDANVRNLKPASDPGSWKASKLDDDIYLALTRYLEESCASPPPNIAVQRKTCSIRGSRYSTHIASRNDSQVFFRLSAHDSISSLVPGIIRAIFTVGSAVEENSEIMLAVHCFTPAPSHVKNFFARYPEFQAGLWGQFLAHEVYVLPASQIVCHAISRPWCEDTLVIRALDRVCSHFSLSPCFG